MRITRFVLPVLALAGMGTGLFWLANNNPNNRLARRHTTSHPNPSVQPRKPLNTPPSDLPAPDHFHPLDQNIQLPGRPTILGPALDGKQKPLAKSSGGITDPVITINRHEALVHTLQDIAAADDSGNEDNFDAETGRVITHYNDTNSDVCLEVDTPAGKSFMSFPASILSAAEYYLGELGADPSSLSEFFPHPYSNVFFNITIPDSEQILGKTTFLNPNRYHVVWLNGLNEYYLKNDGYLFAADGNWAAAGKLPVWAIWNNWGDTITMETDHFFYTENISLIANPKIVLELGTHMGAPDFYIQAQSSCEGDTLPRFIRIDASNIKSFLKQAFANE